MITWRSKSARLESSACGRYSVTTREIHGETWHQARYHPPHDMAELLATSRDKSDARAVCEKHAGANA